MQLDIDKTIYKSMYTYNRESAINSSCKKAGLVRGDVKTQVVAIATFRDCLQMTATFQNEM